MSYYQYRKPHGGDKTILRPSYLHNGISYTGKTTSLYWFRAQVVSLVTRDEHWNMVLPINHNCTLKYIPLNMHTGLLCLALLCIAISSCGPMWFIYPCPSGFLTGTRVNMRIIYTTWVGEETQRCVQNRPGSISLTTTKSIPHYNDVIMSATASQITGVSIVYSAVRSQKISKLRVTDLCAGNSPVTGEFPAQKACNAKKNSIWWRHHAKGAPCG